MQNAASIEDNLSLGAATIKGRPLLKGGYKLLLYGKLHVVR